MVALSGDSNYPVTVTGNPAADGLCVREYMKTPRVPHTCEVLQRRAVHPEAEHLLHRQINGIIPVG